MFPRIETIDDLLPFISSNKQIRVKPDDLTGHTVVCYMVQDEDTFAGENLEQERECRGVSFDLQGRISARTMHKFFNVGERPETMPDQIRWADVDRIMEKRDGSMVTPVLTSGSEFKFKTKKSFSTPEAALADSLCTDETRKEWLLKLLQAGFTPTFEITSPRFPIVVRYEKDELTLLHIRENITGKYMTESEITRQDPPFPIVENLLRDFVSSGVPANIVSWTKLKHYAETAEGVEGVVIQFTNGEMMKLKTAWYINLHHSVTFTRWRDIARTVCADQSDDLKAAFTMVGRSIEPILEVERKVKGYINAVQNAVELHAGNGRALNRTPKDMALALREHELFGLIMRVFRDQEVNYMEYYVKNQLESDWGLEVVS